MPSTVFNSETGRAAVAKSWLPGSKRFLRPKAEEKPVAVEKPTDDPFAVELERAMEETLQELRDADNAKDRAACAQALKNLRETYHLVTGKAKPGVIKPGRERQSRHSPAPEPEADKPAGDANGPAS